MGILICITTEAGAAGIINDPLKPGIFLCILEVPQRYVWDWGGPEGLRVDEYISVDKPFNIFV